jgi:hypothetical protein
MKLDAELLQIALGVLGCCMNGGFLQAYILQREKHNDGDLTIDTDAKAREVFEHLDDVVRAAQREESV